MLGRMSFDLDRIGGRSALSALIDEVLAAGEEARRLYRNGVGEPDEAQAGPQPGDRGGRGGREALIEVLAERYPEAAFLGEETGSAGPSEAGLRWVVDPIDGTRAFIRGIPTWSILLGLEADGRPVLGVAYMPAAEDLFFGVEGEGAWATAARSPSRTSNRWPTAPSPTARSRSSPTCSSATSCPASARAPTPSAASATSTATASSSWAAWTP